MPFFKENLSRIKRLTVNSRRGGTKSKILNSVKRFFSEQLTTNSEQFQTLPVIVNTVESGTNTVCHCGPANGGGAIYRFFSKRKISAGHGRLLRPCRLTSARPRKDRKIHVIANTAKGGVKQSIGLSAKDYSAQ